MRRMNSVDVEEIDGKADGHISKSESGVRDAFVISGQSGLFMGGDIPLNMATTSGQHFHLKGATFIHHRNFVF